MQLESPVRLVLEMRLAVGLALAQVLELPPLLTEPVAKSDFVDLRKRAH